MNSTNKVAVCSRSFSKNPILRSELLDHYQKVTFNNAGLKLNGEDLVEFLRGHDKAITALERLDESIFSKLPDLRVISKHGVGLDMIDLKAMQKYGVKLGWTGGVNRRAVTELAISMMIALLRHVPCASHEVSSGNWRKHIGRQLSNQIIGIIGCGHIGKDLAKILRAFDCRILAHDRLDFPEFYMTHDIEKQDLEGLLKESDIVTLHLPLDHTTRKILNAKRLELMKPTAILINTARGGILDEVHLKKMLLEGRLAGAALDVFDTEPPKDRELIALDNVLATPHIGGSTEEAILAMGRAAIAGLDNGKLPDNFSEISLED